MPKIHLGFEKRMWLDVSCCTLADVSVGVHAARTDTEETESLLKSDRPEEQKEASRVTDVVLQQRV